MLATDDMNMQVINRLTSVLTIVDDSSKSSFTQATFFGQFSSDNEQVSDQLLIRVISLGQLGNWFAWYHQKVHWSRWIDVIECDTLKTKSRRHRLIRDKRQQILYLIILVDEFGWYFTPQYLAEYCVASRSCGLS